jgi:hypothetical protein
MPETPSTDSIHRPGARSLPHPGFDVCSHDIYVPHMPGQVAVDLGRPVIIFSSYDVLVFIVCQ